MNHLRIQQYDTFRMVAVMQSSFHCFPNITTMQILLHIFESFIFLSIGSYLSIISIVVLLSLAPIIHNISSQKGKPMSSLLERISLVKSSSELH